jgi:alkylation response protein AidB-like acyl-CoA dehydrogenase
VHDAHTADALVVAARTRPGAGADGVSLFLLPKGTKGLEVTLLPTMDQTRKLCEVACSDVTVGADALLGAAGAGWTPLSRVLDRATVALCAEMCGGAQKVLDMTVECTRRSARPSAGRSAPTRASSTARPTCGGRENSKSITYYAAWARRERRRRPWR